MVPLLVLLPWVALAERPPGATVPPAQTPQPAQTAHPTPVETPATAADTATERPPPVIEPSPIAIVEIVPRSKHWDASVFSEPRHKAPLMGHVAAGARIPVRGHVHVADARRCESELFYALHPGGFLCADDAVASNKPASTDPVLQVEEGHVLPFDYAMVQAPEEDPIPLFASAEDVRNYANPKRMLGRGDTLAVESKTIRVDGIRYRRSLDGDLVEADQTFRMRRFSQWQGTALSPDTRFPFGWVQKRKAPVYDAPQGGKRIDRLERRTRVDILAEHGEGRKRRLEIGPGRFVAASHVNEVRRIARPEGTGAQAQWIDVDLGEQVVVAYRGEVPQYATLTSSGRGRHRTPRGNYPVWAKASAITMRSQPYDDKLFYVDRVPWVLFFQAHNALHGAYWHDRFGAVKSHGCANLAPKDARYLFEWLEPKLPPGWSAMRYLAPESAPVVHVRNSGLRTPFKQERPPGPPTPEGEAKRLAAAEARRAAQAAAEQAAAEQAAAEQAAAGFYPGAAPFAPPPSRAPASPSPPVSPAQ